MAKHVRLIALVIFIVAVIAACSKPAAESGTNSPGPAQSTSESGTQQPQAEAPNEPYEFSVMLSNETSDYNREYKPDNPYTTELARLTGVKVNYTFFEPADYSNLLTTRLASKTMPNVFQTNPLGITDPTIKSAINAGVFLDLTELLQQYGQNILNAYPENVWKSPQVSMNGKIYGIPKKSALPTRRVLVIRQDFLDRLGMKTPETLDDYLTYFEGVKTTDMNNNGVNDEIPLFLQSGLGGYNRVFEGYFDAFPEAWRWIDGEAVPDIIQPKMKELVAFMRMLYEKGYINQDMFTLKLGERDPVIQSGIVGMYVHDATNVGSTNAGLPSWYTQPETAVDDAVIDVVNGPTTPEGTKRLSLLGTGFLNVYIIDSGTEHPEEIVKYYNRLLSGDEPELTRFFVNGLEGVNYTIDNGKVIYDPAAEENLNIGFTQFILGMQDWRITDEVLEFDSQAERVMRAKTLAMEAAVDQGMFTFMSVTDLPAYKTNPQLGFGPDSLYGQMFSNVLLGREPIDAAFDKFVSDWKQQGGDQLIQEAKQWHLDNTQ